MKRAILIAVLGLLFAMPALLQDEGDCDSAGLQAEIETQLQMIDDDLNAVLREIIHLALGGLFDCADDPQAFDGQPGAQPVLGPLALHEGFYIFKLTTDGSARVEATSLESCGKDMNGVLFNVSAGQAIYSAENLAQAESDCAVYLEMSKISNSWTLEIANVR